jgi:3',5'-cyclic AMP phosphodiesterase CpdA
VVTLAHVSDLHFGREDRAALDWFAGEMAVHRPDAIIVTGDLTMRARAHEFEAARQWLALLPAPVSIEVGNHDLPYFNPLRRLVAPYGRFAAVERMVERAFDLPDVAIIPLRTTARIQWRWNWSKGHVTAERLATAAADLAAIPKRHRLIACHHPLIDAGTQGTARTRGGEDALAMLARAGATAILSGHVHDPFDRCVEVGGRPVRMIGAGTLSERVRAMPASFNLLRFKGPAMIVEPRLLHPG